MNVIRGKTLIPKPCDLYNYYLRGNLQMLAEKNSSNTKFVKTVLILRCLYKNGIITLKEYDTMKEYFKKVYSPDVAMI